MDFLQYTNFIKRYSVCIFFFYSKECIELFRKVIIVDFPKIGLTTEELDKEEVEKLKSQQEQNQESLERLVKRKGILF